MTEREIDISTGKPSAPDRDHELNAEIRTATADKWRHREGEVIRRVVTASGFTHAGRVYERGEIIECKIGSDSWLLTLDAEGVSYLDADPTEQLTRWHRVMLAPIGEVEFDDPLDGSPVHDDRPPPAMTPKGERSAYDAMRAVWAEQDRAKEEPLRIFTAPRRAPRSPESERHTDGGISKPTGGAALSPEPRFEEASTRRQTASRSRPPPTPPVKSPGQSVDAIDDERNDTEEDCGGDQHGGLVPVAHPVAVHGISISGPSAILRASSDTGSDRPSR